MQAFLNFPPPRREFALVRGAPAYARRTFHQKTVYINSKNKTCFWQIPNTGFNSRLDLDKKPFAYANGFFGRSIHKGFIHQGKALYIIKPQEDDTRRWRDDIPSLRLG